MQSARTPYHEIFLRFTILLSIVSILISCQLLPSPAQNTAPAPLFAETTLPPPETFQTELLNPLDAPHTYIEETCRYLRARWNPRSAAPGTVVMVILFKNINAGTTEQPGSIRILDFFELMNQLNAQGFKAINTEQLQAFMERNVAIPPRSVVLIQDGNQSEEYYNKNFRDYFEKWGWGIVNGWVSEQNPDPVLMEQNFSLEHEGFVDHQARGVSPNVSLTDDVSKVIIARELQGSLNGFAGHFGKTPTAIVWPNGGFGIRPVEAARQLRFKLGFTQNSRGPLMYNWMPLADVEDPERPGLIPEGPIRDPLMTLPVYSANEALLAIDIVRAVGKSAADYAEANREAEFAYYEAACEEKYGPIPIPIP